MERRPADPTLPRASGGMAAISLWALGTSLLFGIVFGASAAAPAQPRDGAFAGPVLLAVVGKESRSIEQLQGRRADPLILRTQKALTEAGIYKGPLDGVMDVELRSAIRVYQKRNGLGVTGIASEELAIHLETASKVDVLLGRLDVVRKERMAAARAALLSNPKTRHLANEAVDEIADPTRNPEPCFRKPTALCLLTEASESAKAIHKTDRRDWALGEILAAQAKAGFTKDAMATVRRIHDPRLIMVALRKIAEGLAHSGRGEEALTASEIIPDVVKRADALVAIATIEAAREDTASAGKAARRLIQVTEEVEDPVRRIAYYTKSATVLSRAGDKDGSRAAIRRAEDLLRGGIKRAQRGTALRHLAAARAEMGQPAEALNVLKNVKGASDRTPVLVAVAIAHADAGQLEEAFAVTADITSARYRAVTLSHIGIAEVKAGKGAKAWDTLAQASEAAETIKFPYARSFALNRIAIAFTEVAKAIDPRAFEDAVETARRIKDDQMRAHVLWTIWAERNRLGDAAGAQRTKDLAREASTAIKSSLSRVWMFGDISSCYVAAGEPNHARTAFLNALEVAQGVDNAWVRARALSKLASTLADLDRPGQEAVVPAK
ncbi:MAG: peptidoglycan-binding domain-containing protein [Rhodospirillales bacterium]|nr:peptidoglycan-binding domain-containing protein [Rhodospirillales bacterium]